MTKKIILILLLIIALLTILIIVISIKQQKNIAVDVIDGDTFMLATGEKVRLIGIDAPEKGEQYYNESKEMLEDLILDKIIALERDISNHDLYGRLLRYAYVNEIFVNGELVSLGYAEAAEYPPDTRYADELKQLENDAKASNLGIWYSEEQGDDSCIELGCPAGTSYVGSINSDKYHSCDSRFAKMISPENIICFASEADASEQGYVASE